MANSVDPDELASSDLDLTVCKCRVYLGSAGQRLTFEQVDFTTC